MLRGIFFYKTIRLNCTRLVVSTLRHYCVININMTIIPRIQVIRALTGEISEDSDDRKATIVMERFPPSERCCSCNATPAHLQKMEWKRLFKEMLRVYEGQTPTPPKRITGSKGKLVFLIATLSHGQRSCLRVSGASSYEYLCYWDKKGRGTVGRDKLDKRAQEDFNTSERKSVEAVPRTTQVTLGTARKSKKPRNFLCFCSS
jgi:hypothetical protein